MTIKKAIGTIHLWLGLTSGLLVFIIAITGCIYAFQDEIQNATQPYRRVPAEARPFMPPTAIQHTAERRLPGKQVHAVMYQSHTHSAKAIFYSDAGDYYYLVYVNPYNGEVLKVKNENHDFFRFIINGHYNLWLPMAVGHVVVASATLMFFIMMLSGIILWWPRNKKGARQRLTIKWNASWRRTNFDVHSVVGFYVSWVGIIFAVTGLVWGFQWFANAYYTVASGGRHMVEYKEPMSKSAVTDTSAIPAADRIWMKLQAGLPAQGSIEVHIPHDSAAIAVNINPDPATYWKTDYRYFDQHSLAELSVQHLWGRFSNARRADKLMRMNYDIHVGAILGLPGKIFAFLCSLVIASLPVTGTLMWWGRRNKKARPHTV